MSATRPIIDAVAAHLQAALPWVSVDVFPENPADYPFTLPCCARCLSVISLANCTYT